MRLPTIGSIFRRHTITLPVSRFARSSYHEKQSAVAPLSVTLGVKRGQGHLHRYCDRHGRKSHYDAHRPGAFSDKEIKNAADLIGISSWHGEDV